MHDIDGVASLREPHGVLVNSRRAQALIVSRADDPACVDEALDAGYAVIDLLGRLGFKVGDDLARRIGLI